MTNDLIVPERKNPFIIHLAHLATLCERLSPNYEAFYDLHQWGNPEFIFSGVDLIWAYVSDKEVLDTQQITDLVPFINSNIPDSDEFPSFYAALAQYAANSVQLTLKMCLSQKLTYATQVVAYANDSYLTYLYAVNRPLVENHSYDSSLELWCKATPIYTNEQRLQQKTVSFLNSRRNLSGEDIDHLRQLGRSGGLSLRERRLYKAVEIND